jgi:SAM-dependent methyltransferase
MQITEAANLLQVGDKNLFSHRSQWADLGAGDGTFTRALATHLGPGSTIYAVDQRAAALKKIPNIFQGVTIRTYVGDFILDDLPIRELAGIMMANSLHYVKDKGRFIKKIASCLREPGCFLIVEYERANPLPVWVPYPIDFLQLAALFKDCGYFSTVLLNKRQSVFGPMMYAAFIER